MKYFYIVLASLLVSIFGAPSIADAADAKSCISFAELERYGTKRNSMTNSCNTEVHVVWCIHVGGTKFDCGVGGKYYQQQNVLKPGEVYDNVVTLPAGHSFHYAACSGGYGSVIRNDPASSAVTCK